MAIAKSLRDVEPMFMQPCPFCGRKNRMVVKGVYIRDGKAELYPDIGYSFCNCKSVFYTNYENIKGRSYNNLQHYKHPLKELKNIFDALPRGNKFAICMSDPFFCEWGNNPYTFEHWNPRVNHVIFDMTQFCEEAKAIGFEVVSAKRQFDVNADRPKTMEIVLWKP